MGEAMSRVSQVKRVPVELARKYGLYGDGEDDILAALEHGDEGSVDIPSWRHAVINFPHPLLQQGLVILNKIDGLWDELKADADVEREIDRQVRTTAHMLGVPTSQVYAASAQKALLAKVNGDDALLARSRLPALEASLSHRLIPAKREIVGAASQSEVRALAATVKSILDARLAGVTEQLAELTALRGKNQDVVGHMMERVRSEKEVFERGLARYTALRNVFTQQTNDLFDHIGLEALRANAGRTRRQIEDSPFTRGVRNAMSEFFRGIHGDFTSAARQATEIHDMMRAMYARFAKEHGLAVFSPPPFSVLKFQKEVERLERAYTTHFNTLWNMVSKAKFALMKRFFETIASRVKHVYVIANRDAEAWLKAVMSPLETQVREHHLQLRRRLDSIKRIHQASGELEERIDELTQQADAIRAQLRGLEGKVAEIEAVVAAQDLMPAAANA
jgi:predicted nuclease with TOPRIM domain